MRLPVALEKKLAAIFPTARQRDQFVADAVSKALENSQEPTREMQPTSIGGSLHLFTDGGSRGNPGQAAVGCVLMEPDGTVLKEFCEKIGIETNNIAEYKALIAGLKMTQEFQPNHLICHLDSELVVKQVNGEYRVKMVTFQPLIDEINRLKNQFKSVQVTYIPRAQNSRADALVNKALDGR